MPRTTFEGEIVKIEEKTTNTAKNGVVSTCTLSIKTGCGTDIIIKGDPSIGEGKCRGDDVKLELKYEQTTIAESTKKKK